nr:MAG TPA: hypothetical protein [Caudoviricetes sp.]
MEVLTYTDTFICCGIGELYSSVCYVYCYRVRSPNSTLRR